MSSLDCPANPLGHDWNNSLTCRLCPATRTPEEAILSGLASRRGGDETSARALLEAYRIAVLTAAEAGQKSAAPAVVPEFFRPRRTYAREHHGRVIEFHVRYVDTASDCTFPTAFGWRKDPEIDVLLAMDADDFHGCGWTDITDTTTGDSQ